MKNFDVELAKKGWPVVTRGGRKARVVCFDRLDPNGTHPIVALIPMDREVEFCSLFCTDGRADIISEYPFDLFLTDTWEGHDENGNPLNEPEIPWNSDDTLNHPYEGKTKEFAEILKGMLQTYIAKNHDYGDSFGQSIKAYGPIAGLTRISDKFHRLESLLLKGEQKVLDEKIGDTLLDLANYAVMLKMEMDGRDCSVELSKTHAPADGNAE